MAFRFGLISRDGDDLGPFATTEPNWQPGDELRAAGNRRYRVVAVIPIERIAEFVDGATSGLLHVEPI